MSNVDRFNGSVDEKNSILLNALETAGIQIEFEVKPEFEYWAIQPRKKFVIAAPDSLPNPEMLAHELLHIMMETLGFIPTHVIVKVFTNRNCRFNTSELPNWQNLIAHCKMIDHFTGMGYDGDKFTANEENAFHLEQLLPLLGDVEERIDTSKKNQMVLLPDVLADFLSVFIAIKSYELQYLEIEKKPIDPNFYYKKLRDKDSDLFDMINEEFNTWINEGDNYSNVDFYNRINHGLERLGYPIAEQY